MPGLHPGETSAPGFHPQWSKGTSVGAMRVRVTHTPGHTGESTAEKGKWFGGLSISETELLYNPAILLPGMSPKAAVIYYFVCLCTFSVHSGCSASIY